MFRGEDDDAERLTWKPGALVATQRTVTEALSAACMVNLDLQRGESSASDLESRINAAIEQAKNAGDSYLRRSRASSKLRCYSRVIKFEAQKEAEKALELAGDNQSDNVVSARIVLAEIESINGNNSKALAELDNLADSTYREQNVGQNIEVRLTSAKLMKQSGSAKQRSEASVLLNRDSKRSSLEALQVIGGESRSCPSWQDLVARGDNIASACTSMSGLGFCGNFAAIGGAKCHKLPQIECK